ncbi:MAG: penicillin acylase family protein, partial [Bacteroidota bacterium]|nr:penicillin acylase family protein [Bacteroidota bacterium]
PKRDPKYDWTKPVDGSTSATDWQGLHSLTELITVHNPATGWIQNCNSSPFTVSGSSSPKETDFPKYMAPNGDNFRGVTAAKILSSTKGYTLDKVIASGYNTHLSAFDVLIPALEKAYTAHQSEPGYASLRDAMQLLRGWDRNSAANSVATTVAIDWAQRLLPAIQRSNPPGGTIDQVIKTHWFADHAAAADLLNPLLQSLDELKKTWGTWQKPWGEINRYQRLTGNLTETYDDSKPSIPCGFAASTWGCLPSFVSGTYGTQRRYGFNGNSFICAVEFGRKVKAKSLLAGGESGDPASPHFGDQAEMYTKGIFKDVLFYKEDVVKQAEKTYHPGE